MTTDALRELLYKIADDQLVIGHRNSEWTGFGPLLEEDIAFSSLAQDKIGHSQAMYQLLEQLGEGSPDHLAFFRTPSEFRNSVFTELPNLEYDFSLIRHFLFDTAEALRFEMLSGSSEERLAAVARKIQGELRYHTLHARTWIVKLGSATEESVGRMQRALDYALPFATGVFEPSPLEETLIATGIFEGERELERRWRQRVADVIGGTRLVLPPWESVAPVYGGRTGKHTEHLAALLYEMSEVFRIDPQAEW